jgi:protein SCO1/2
MRQWIGLLVILLIVCLAPSADGAASFDPFAAAVINSKPGAPVPLDLAFQDEGGRTTSLRVLGGGRPIILAPVLHKCPNICGVTLGGLGDAVASQPRGSNFVVIALSIDPHETPMDAAASLAALEVRQSDGWQRNIHALTGTAEAIASVTDALGYHYAYDPALHQFAHAAAIAVLTQDGRLVRWIYGLAPDPDELRTAIVSAQSDRIGSLGEQLILLCYHYDPRTGRYTLLVNRLLQMAGTATALVLAAVIAFAWRRERTTWRGGR